MSTTPATHWMPPPTKDFNAAKRQYVEQFSSIMVSNTYLKIAVLALSLVNVGLVILNVKTYQTFPRSRDKCRHPSSRQLHRCSPTRLPALTQLRLRLPPT